MVREFWTVDKSNSVIKVTGIELKNLVNALGIVPVMDISQVGGWKKSSDFGINQDTIYLSREEQDNMRVVAIEAALVDIPNRYHPLIRRTMLSIKAFKIMIIWNCLDCCGWDSQSIRECTSLICPFWKVRPYQIIGVQDGDGI